MKDTFKLGKVDVRPLRQAEIGNLDASGGFRRMQSGSEVCVCVFMWGCVF